MGHAKRGFALVYLLLFGVLIALFVMAVLALGEQGLRTTRGGVDRARALYAAEAGLAEAMALMEVDPSWEDGFTEVALPGSTASYSLSFASISSETTSADSLNNLLGTAPADTYHGPLSLPAHSALLVVTGRSGTATRTVEALVVTGLDVPSNDALTATGAIRLAGEVVVDGRKSLSDPASRPANLHHNSDLAGVVGVAYSGGSADWERFRVSGEVTSSSPDSTGQVMVFDTPHSQPTARTSVPLKELPRPNILEMLADHAHLPGVSLPSAPGPVSLTGESFYGSDVVINGDLTLVEGARMYVGGDLSVNGSVRGKGTLIVGGRSEFYGEVDVSGQATEYIALLSRGGVVLKGFRGEAYMQALAASDSVVAEHWRDLAFGLQGVNESLQPLASLDPIAFKNALMMTDTDIQIDRFQGLVANNLYGRWMSADAPFWDGSRPRHWNNAAYFRDLIGPSTPLSSETFLHQRFQALDDWFRQAQFMRGEGAPVAATGRSGHAQLEYYTDRDPVHDGGLFDSIQSIQLGMTPFTAETEGYFLDAMAAAQGFDFDRLGNANFKGLIYTSGAFVGKDDISILGSVIVNGDPNVPALVEGAMTFQPGEVGLFGHSRLTLVEEFLDSGVHNLLGTGSLDVKRWVSR